MTDKVQKIREEVQRLQDLTMDENKNFYSEAAEGEYNALCNIEHFIDSLQEEPVSVWHDASEEPNDMGSCLIFYGCKESVGHYLHYEPVLYNKKEKVFVTSSFPHPTGYKVEQKSIDGGCVAEVYKNRRDRISISDITQWCYLKDLHNLSNVQRTGKNWKEPVNGDLEKVAEEAAVAAFFVSPQWTKTGERLFKAGAQWQKQQDSKLPKVWDRETLDEYAYQVAYDLSNDWMRETPTWDDVETAVKLGVKWQKEHLWKPADGDDLPAIDREVIALLNSGKVVFAHRPYKGKYIGKSLTTGNIETFENKTYGKGGWNIPDVKWWLDCGWPNEEE